MAVVSSLGPRGASRPHARRRRQRLGLAAVVALGVLGGPAVTDALGSGGAPPATVTVRPGDTLWSIAVATGTGDDVRQRVDAISAANHLSGNTVIPGEVLTLPH